MTYTERTVAAVVPAHNEAEFVPGVIRSMPAYVDHIIVVDDASDDGTADAARGVGDRRVDVVTLTVNRGVGGAVMSGYRRALEIGCDVIVKMDGDGQMSPADLPALLDAVVQDGYAYAKGNRFLLVSPRRAMPRGRFIGNMMLTFLTKLASGYWQIFDPQNGYTAIRAEALQRLDLGTVRQDFFFENDMLVQLNLSNLRVKDVPMPARYGREISGVNPLSVLFTFPVLLLQRFALRVYRKYMLHDFSPIALFLITGVALLLWGVSFGSYLWIKSSITGSPTPTGTIMLAIVPLFLGFQLLLQAIVLDIQETPR